MKPIKSKSASLQFRASTAALATLFIAFSSSAHAQAVDWLGGNATNGSWNASGNTSPLIGAGSTTTDVTFNNLTRATANETGGNRTVRSLTYGAAITSAFTTNMTSSTVLTFQAASGNASITVNSLATGNITFNGGAGVTGSQSLASQLDVTHNGSGLLLFNRQFAGAGGITKLGSGTMQIAAPNNNSFSGALNVNTGRLIMASTFGATGDLNSSSSIDLGGGILEIRTTNALSKQINPNLTVSSASTLAYNNTAATDQSLTLQTGTMVLNANLTLQNISSSSAGSNIINVTRNLTGSGNLIVETYNNVASGAASFSNGRVQLGGDNTAWTGNLVVAKGTVQYSGTNASGGSGSITIGNTGDAFGAGLGFNTGNTSQTLSKAITVTTGGIRLIRNNSGPDTTANLTLSGPITLDGNLTLDHAGLGAGKSITVSGEVAGAGGLNVTFVGPHQVTDSSVRLTGTNSYKGATSVSSGTLVINGNQSAATGAVSVSGKLAGSGTVGGATIINSGGIHNAGDPTVAGGVGSQIFSSSLNYASSSIFEWDLNANDTAAGFDTVSAAGNIDVGTSTVFKVVFGTGVNLSNSFWSTPFATQTWSMTSIFGKAFNSGSFSSVVSTADPITQGAFSISGNTLTWTAVPEPTSALAGLLLTAGLLRRRRQEKGRSVASGTTAVPVKDE